MTSEKNKEKREEGRVLAALKAVQSDMATMQSEMKFLRDAVTKVPEPGDEMRNNVATKASRPKRGCRECDETGLSDMCSRCFLCGGANHIARYCNMKFRNKGKPQRAAPEGHGVAQSKTEMKSHLCNYCLKKENRSNEFQICSICKIVHYCSKDCQREHWVEHKTLCTSIKNLSTTAGTIPGLGDSADTNMFFSHLTPKQIDTAVKLVGEKCQVKFQLNGKETEILWDTGAHVSILPERILKDMFQDIPVKDIHELLGAGSDLKLEAANGTQIPYNGWVGVNFKLLNNSAKEITVPFLVTNEDLNCPIIGYNVIELFVKDNGPETALPAVAESFDNVSNAETSALVNFMNSDLSESLCAVRTSKKKVVVPSGQTMNISCRANTGPIRRNSPALFEPDEQTHMPIGLTVQEALTTVKQGKSSLIDIPVTNTTQHDIVLPGRLVPGNLQLVRSVTPLEVKLKKEGLGEQLGNIETEIESDPTKPSSLESEEPRLPDVDLSGLTPEQKRDAMKMLYEEADAFAMDDEDDGCIEGLQMNIHLTDDQPIQKNYLSIPRPLHPEVKAYIEDLLDRKEILYVNRNHRFPAVWYVLEKKTVGYDCVWIIEL